MKEIKEFPVIPAFNSETDFLKLKIFGMSKLNKGTGITADFTLPTAYATSKTSKFPVWDSSSSADAATVNLVPIYKNEVIAQAVGQAMTINIATTNAELGDLYVIKLANDGTQRTVTFGTGVKPSGTVVGTISKTINVTLMFDGTNWVEIARSAAYTP